MDYIRADMENALTAITSMLERSGKIAFAKGTPQHTLQANRIAALHVAQALVQSKLGLSDEAGNHTHEELQKAVAPIASLISKSEKAQQKLREGSWQHTMLQRNLAALYIATALLEEALR